MNKVLVYGSVNYDLVISSDKLPNNGETISGYGFFTNSGGKGANQAVASSKLGAKTYLVGAVGNDTFGEECRKAIASYGVNTEFLDTLSTNTGCAVIIVVDHDNRIILDRGANYLYNKEKLLKIVDENVEANDVFLTQLETPIELVSASLQLAHQKHAITILNPAPVQKLPDEVFKYIDILVPNEGELYELTGENDVEKGVSILYNKGVKNVIVTLGSKGCYYNKKLYPSIPTKAVDTTCAGDTFIGTLSSQLSKGKTIEESIGLCQQAASLTIQKKGAQISIPTIDEINQIFRN